jgi:hypothetical protein
MSKITDDQLATKKDLSDLRNVMRSELLDVRNDLRQEIQASVRASEARIVKKVTEDVTREVTKNVSTEIGSLLSDAMTIIGEKFVGLENQFHDMKADMSIMKEDIRYLKDGQVRIEHKLDANIAVTDNLLIRTGSLEAKMA